MVKELTLMKSLDKISRLKFKTMQSYCLKSKKNTEKINPRVSKSVMVKQCYYQNVLYVARKNLE